MIKSCYARSFIRKMYIKSCYGKFFGTNKNIMLCKIMLWVYHVRRGLAVCVGCVQVYASERRCAQVCAGMHGCARVCAGVCGCESVCTGVGGYAWVCVCMNFQKFFWRIESLHQRTLISILYEFLYLYFK